MLDINHCQCYRGSMITPAQSRAARALLDWSQAELAEAAHLGMSTIRDFEKGRRVPTHNNYLGIQRALEVAGVEFIADNQYQCGLGAGVRFRECINLKQLK
jgi:transcriptional regulator with XRE-family HTH domain